MTSPYSGHHSTTHRKIFTGKYATIKGLENAILQTTSEAKTYPIFWITPNGLKNFLRLGAKFSIEKCPNGVQVAGREYFLKMKLGKVVINFEISSQYASRSDIKLERTFSNNPKLYLSELEKSRIDLKLFLVNIFKDNSYFDCPNFICQDMPHNIRYKIQKYFLDKNIDILIKAIA